MGSRSQLSKSLSVNKNKQPTITESFKNATPITQDIDGQVTKLIRYILIKGGEHLILRKLDIKKHILVNTGANFSTILDRATTILQDVYGYNIIPLGEKSVGSYIVTNTLPHIEDPIEERENLEITHNAENETQYPDDVCRILLLLILSHIFMANNRVTEVSLFSFLKNLQIDPERKHPLFGNVKNYIFNTLKLQKYIEIEMDQMTKKQTFSWGPRSEAEISKHDILKFVCKIYKDRTPASWISQFKTAQEQQLKNNRDEPHT